MDARKALHDQVLTGPIMCNKPKMLSPNSTSCQSHFRRPRWMGSRVSAARVAASTMGLMDRKAISGSSWKVLQICGVSFTEMSSPARSPTSVGPLEVPTSTPRPIHTHTPSIFRSSIVHIEEQEAEELLPSSGNQKSLIRALAADTRSGSSC